VVGIIIDGLRMPPSWLLALVEVLVAGSGNLLQAALGPLAYLMPPLDQLGQLGQENRSRRIIQIEWFYDVMQ
jgi:hypothetical protein